MELGAAAWALVVGQMRPLLPVPLAFVQAALSLQPVPVIQGGEVALSRLGLPV